MRTVRFDVSSARDSHSHFLLGGGLSTGTSLHKQQSLYIKYRYHGLYVDPGTPALAHATSPNLGLQLVTANTYQTEEWIEKIAQIITRIEMRCIQP